MTETKPVLRINFDHPGVQTRWEGNLPPELHSSEQRLSAVVNILQNGGEAVTTLMMTRQWETYQTINTKFNQLFTDPKDGIDPATTLNYLVMCLETVGAAAKSTLDDTEWSLTPFGETVKPAIIFGWRKLLQINAAQLEERQVSSKDVYSAHSRTTRDKEGNILRSSPMIRATILSLAGQERRPITVTELMKATGASKASIRDHILGLEAAELITKESYDAIMSGPIPYTLTQQGIESQVWKCPDFPRYAVRCKVAVEHLTRNNQRITRETVQQAIVDLYGQNEPHNIDDIRKTLRDLEETGYIDAPSREPEVSLTTVGDLIYEEILLPLSRWAVDPDAEPEINEIRQALDRNPNAFKTFYQDITSNFVATSPWKTSDPEARRSAIIQIIKQLRREYPRGITGGELSSYIDRSSVIARRDLRILLASGDVVINEGEGEANRIRYILNPERYG